MGKKRKLKKRKLKRQWPAIFNWRKSGKREEKNEKKSKASGDGKGILGLYRQEKNAEGLL